MSGRAAAATKISTALRKPSIRSLYDKQEIFTVPKACRSVKDVLIGYDAYSAGRFFRHPLQYFQNELRLPRIKEHFLIRAINQYATDWQSPFTDHVYETEFTSVRLNMVYLHIWLLNFHLSQPFKDESFVAEECKRDRNNQERLEIDAAKVSELTQRLIRREHVRMYTNTFDDSIHEELRRQYRVINHSLTAIFVHSPRSLSRESRLVTRLDDDDLEELILYNILNEEPEAKREQVKRISDYIRISVHEEDKYTFATRMESYYYKVNAQSLFKPFFEQQKQQSCTPPLKECP